MSTPCRTCKHLRTIPTDEGSVYRCGYIATVPMPWPTRSLTIAPNYVIAPRHVVPGYDYPEALGSTADWTDQVDCPVWEARA